MKYKLVGIAAVVFLTLLCGRPQAQEVKSAIFAGGCFWCVESDFDQIPGVVETISGYTGGTAPNPTYRQVTAGGTGHYEAVEIRYDPAKVSYETLLNAFWRSVDPTDPDGQFCDRGDSYRTAIFVANDQERRLAEATRDVAQAVIGEQIVTPIVAAGPFFPAEDYHQGYYKKNPARYRYYRWACQRNQTVKEIWGEQAYQGIPEHG